ncbi:sugar ABC transporter ATP-binding protein [Rubellimicrobium roseum]|uniref:Sugar ABC transporter ATP-binding protein n=1 Tax=Rubellimicrobium roseum TaxID=687525 RepID=A0A5C4N4M9_9RHOB|nr:sugar ABC transporter ATP-binding protein [Rubellimicrobium roseum]TNC63104.1 sugar ABC transporter ATP-binding protein [Rubellimicrobium roseum]
MTDAPMFEMRGIAKAFPGVQALSDVSFAARSGEVHALVGENGAGKSTLMRILSGVYKPDAGGMTLDGRPFAPSHPLEARSAGIAVIWQEFSLLPDRTVAENLHLGREPVRGWRLDRRAMREGARAALAVFGEGHGIAPELPVRDLSVAQQQMVEIARALAYGARVLVMDEPTAALDEAECERLFTVVDGLRARGTAVVYITHRMGEIARLATRVTVLKDGRVSAALSHVPPAGEVIAAMVGRDLGQFFPPPAAPGEIGPPVLSVRHAGNAQLRGISFDLRAGEITGFAGIQGAGRTALAMALFGVDPFTVGEVTLSGVFARFASPREAVRAGLVLLPGHRKAQGLMLMQSVRDNGLVSPRAFAPLAGNPSRPPAVDTTGIEELFRALDLRAGDLDAPVRTLSGGNQQKVIVARWLAMTPRVLVFVEPTRGIDVNAKASIYTIMRDLARRGSAVMVVSSDLPEVMGVSDRILVMREGRLVGETARGASEAEVMALATGHAEEVAV